MSLTNEVTTEQKIFTASARTNHRSIGDAVEEVSELLGKHVAKLSKKNKSPVINSVSHNSGFDGYVGFYANIVAVITVRETNESYTLIPEG